MSNISNIGVVGLGVMGKNIARNMLSHGFKVSGYNRSFEKTKALIDMNIDGFTGFENIKDFVASLESPKKVFLMVPAGEAVDKTIDELVPLLSKGDIIMDGGNSFFKDTNARNEKLTKLGIHYFGVGVSGGEEGALKGPSIMPSGNKESYPLIGNILEAISAKKDGEPCCVYIGPEGSGHYVKMVHNAIEYADMQLLAEIYLVLKYVNGYKNSQIADIIEEWNKGEVSSYLVEITYQVLREKDDLTEKDLIDVIKDRAGNKGTGRWTSIEALNQEFNASLLTAAYQARVMSNNLHLRKELAKSVKTAITQPIPVKELHKAYSLAKAVAYSQGFGLYTDASNRYGWKLNLKEIAAIFRAGCIIKARLLSDIMEAYADGAEDLILYKSFKEKLVNNNEALRELNIAGLKAGLALPVFMSASTYLNQVSSECLGANIIQGQRDYFGAHTYERTDREGFYHHNWSVNE
jgi:phosphogluconate dehydrogenase (decarboxylating)